MNESWQYAKLIKFFMNKKSYIVAISILVLGGYLFLRNQTKLPAIGGDRDKKGCLLSAGYAWDEEVGACIRSFEMTKDILQAVKIAVNKIGREYALTVVSFNSYEEIGAYDITFEHGLERRRETVYIKNWQASK